MRGMPPGMASLLKQKYAILQQDSNARTTAANAGAALDMARAGVIPAESRANIAATEASTDLTREQAKYFGPTALANIGLTKAQTGRTNAETTFISGAQTDEARSRTRANNAGAKLVEFTGNMFDNPLYEDPAKSRERSERAARNAYGMLERYSPLRFPGGF